MARVSIIGAGSWGTALSMVLCENGYDVMLWSHRKEQSVELEQTHVNSKLPGVKLPDKLQFTSDIAIACLNCNLIVLAVPSTATRETAVKIKPYIGKGQSILAVSKGIEEDTLLVQTEIIEEEIPDAKVGVLSGPSHAEEVCQYLPTLVVVGSKDRFFALFVQEIFMNSHFRVYVSPDVLGIEVGAALKNVIALAAGMSDGLGFGDNAKAALITRGIREITSLAVAMGGSMETLNGLAGIGDLIVTCGSIHSRNRKAGMLIGQGKTMDEAMDEVSMVVEGVYSAKAAKALGEKYQMSLPIIDTVNHVLFDNLDVKEAVVSLMNRDKKSEFAVAEW